VLRKLTGTLLEMCEGQYLDMCFENAPQVSTEAYLEMVSKKTAALIEGAACCGAMISTDDEELIGHYQRYGRNLGIAYQLIDDILGVWGQISLTGKPQGSDFKNKKKNLPFLYALAKASPQQREQLLHLYAQEVITDQDCACLAAHLSDLGSEEFCRELAAEYAREAEKELRETGVQNAAQDILASLAVFAVKRLA
jgi:geranylgeranyl diphosphate synthase type I